MTDNRKVVEVDGKIVKEQSGGNRKYRTINVNGKVSRLRILDANSQGFTAQFTHAFRNNVRRARKENSKLVRQD